ncbi:MAG: ABC transporter permease [Oceanibaculum nanhaiense]|uniref:ABC transporter permease n=1 Tax=Oceanibaculum nanhaiense TaxID=1909734 RepID=UPI0032F07EFB
MTAEVYDRDTANTAAAPSGAAAGAVVGARRRHPLAALAGTKGLIVPALLLAGWAALSWTGVFAANLVPSPEAVLAEISALWASGDLTSHIGVTLTRVLFGFLAGTAAATLLGALTGYSRTARELLDPTLQALKAVPSLAWVPLFILWFGIFEASKVTLIAVGVFFPIYLNLVEGIQGVDRKLVEVAKLNRFSRLDLVRRVLLPATLPSYVVGLRAGLALGWMFVIAAELMGASEGLGYLMVDGQMTGRPAVIVASLILFAIAGKLTDAILAASARPFLAWQDGFGDMKGASNARNR